jgi:hypothetical protein
MESNYILQKTGGSFCPKCNNEVYLLCDKVFKKGAPAFFICFDCKTVAQVGKGPVEMADF